MTLAQLARRWDRMRLRHGICLRAIERLPADHLDAAAIPAMRTPKQLVVHLYANVLAGMIEGILRGRIEEIDERPIASAIGTHAELLRNADECFARASRAVAAFTDDTLASTVTTPWNYEARGSSMLGLMEEEYLHHRGQLYVYLRALGAAPPSMWDFANNAPAYRPRTDARA